MGKKTISDVNITPSAVAEFFLTKQKLSPKKLQKLTYYAYAWFIALNNQDKDDISNSLFSEEPEAWLHGPVFPSLYKEYRTYGWHEIPKKNMSSGIKFDNPDVTDILEQVWRKYGKYSADELEYLTHQESPWKNARRNTDEFSSSRNKISKRDIFLYYNSLINAKNPKS